MINWIATANGALDLTDSAGNTSDAELMLVSTLPSEPLGLQGEPAALWRRLVAESPVADTQLTEEQRILVREFAEAGIASSDETHPARQHEIPKPWLSSPFHELLYALIARIADSRGIRIVFIKGPVLHKQGLRTREHSGDIDVWVDPKCITQLAKALEPWGWELAPGFWGDLPAYHSMTLTPQAWGCEIDLHRHMPGCALPDSEAFDILKTHADKVKFAGVEVLAPVPVANAVLSALHFTRPHPQPNPPAFEDQAVKVLELVGAESLEFADTIRATAALEPAFLKAFPQANIRVDYRPPLNWRYRAEGNPVKRTLLVSRSVPAREWPRFLARLVWPEDSVAFHFDKAHGGKSTTAFGARMRRFRYAVVATFSSKHRL